MSKLIEKMSLDSLADVIPDEKKPYWVGLSDDCPLNNCVVGGVELCKSMVYRPFTNKSNPFEDDVPTRGKVLWLTDQQVLSFNKWIRGAIIRREGKNLDRAEAYNILQHKPNSKQEILEIKPWFNKRKGDELLVKYIWFIELDSTKLPTLGKHRHIHQFGLAGTPEPEPNLIEANESKNESVKKK